ncbi:MAG: UvrD-helicase domain-containing protein [bacterium]|nr:UvrD-helicase domain-containing protein [bacterium]
MDWMDVKAVAAGSGEQAPREPAPRDAAGAVPVLGPIEGLLDSLNPPQRAACEHEEGPLLILAGPGSGKTRVITHRIVHLLTTGRARPDEILAITFTNKAAREMRDRVEKRLGGTKGLWISTFHSLCARILRRDAEALTGYTRDFSIYDTGDRNLLLKRLIKELGFDPKRFRPAVVGGWISNLKNRVAADGLRLDSDGGMEGEVYDKVRRAYEAAMRENNALDFDDLLLKVLELFDEHPGIRDNYSRRFRFVMVDEYQDTNRVQYLLTQHFASHHGNLAVCGDPDQSIYAWRGADIRNILDFEKDYGAAELVRLEQNYRSKGTILAAASAVIAHNNARKAKDLWTEDEDGERIAVLECGDENDEAREIAMQIQGFVGRGGSYGDMAIFYRANFMQRAIESALRLARVPYQIVGGLEFYSKREIRDLVAYLRLVVNPADDVAFERVVNVPARGVGATSLARLSEWARGCGVSLVVAARSSEALEAIRGRAKKGLAEFSALIEQLVSLREASPAVVLDFLLEEFNRERWLREMDDGSGTDDREANIDELRAHAEEYDRLHPDAGLRGFLEEVALVSDTDNMESDVAKVTLMTLHSCKGLEYPYVFIAGVEEELLPHARALAETMDPDAGLEEERRLFYVGMTRARERLFLSHAGTRLFFGESRWTRKSRFLEEIPGELVEGGRPDLEEDEALGAYEPREVDAGLAVGQVVVHDHFGTGTILQLTGSGVNARAVVDFVHHGTKQLLLQYAGLSPAS